MLGESDRSENVVRWESNDEDDARDSISIPPPFNVNGNGNGANFQHSRLGHSMLSSSAADDLHNNHWPDENFRYIEDDSVPFDIDRLDRSGGGGVSFHNASPLHASTGYSNNFHASHAPLQQTHSRWINISLTHFPFVRWWHALSPFYTSFHMYIYESCENSNIFVEDMFKNSHTIFFFLLFSFFHHLLLLLPIILFSSLYTQ